jgi:AcrR family transcriptional regulator
MARDAEATKKRLLEAAMAEFAEYGIAGARVERIAEAAQSNKAQIYHYFQSKDGLFDAVFNELCLSYVRESPIDASDLPEYAGKIFDSYEAHPAVPRLVAWYRLERAGSSDPLDIVVASLRDKEAAIAAAQAAGGIPARYTAAELLALIVHLAEVWSARTAEFSVVTEPTTSDRRRAVVVDSVKALLAQQ